MHHALRVYSLVMLLKIPNEAGKFLVSTMTKNKTKLWAFGECSWALAEAVRSPSTFCTW